MSRVLMVDDHDTLRLLISVILGPLGHSVISAENGEQALMKLVTHPIDLLITDIHMPVMNGIELTKTVREYYPAIFILVITSDSELGIAALDAGAHLYLAKPFARNQLIESVDKILRSS